MKLKKNLKKFTKSKNFSDLEIFMKKSPPHFEGGGGGHKNSYLKPRLLNEKIKFKIKNNRRNTWLYRLLVKNPEPKTKA